MLILIFLDVNFSLNTHRLTVSASTGGTVEGNGDFTHGSLSPITAIPDEGYYFAGWLETMTQMPWVQLLKWRETEI